MMDNLPWPLSMVGRIGENDETSRSDENTFPESSQSILKVIDSQNDVGKEYQDHNVSCIRRFLLSTRIRRQLYKSPRTEGQEGQIR